VNWIEAIIIAVVEGITEFLPISSTGHMIIVSSIFGIEQDQFTKLYTVCIQFGAILSVVVMYGKRFLLDVKYYRLLFIAFLPAVFAGLFLNDWVDALLGNVMVVAVSLLIGGIVLLFVDGWFKSKDEKPEPGNLDAVWIGCWQVLAMIPGVSRSAATIIGGMSRGLDRKGAAEFSFFLAVPTMFAATCKKLYDFYKKGIDFDSGQLSILVVGNIVAFLVAILAIKAFVTALTKHGFKWFGVYRIIIGGLILILLAMGHQLQLVD
jgi:undecaprenyl-diphosphatase